ncbi:MAG: thioredoxin-disulfide reductase, partial [Candidatus Methanomethylicota archaeon]
KRIVGEHKVEGIEIVNTSTGNVEHVKVEGVFIAIGEEPNNEIAKKLGLKLTEEGYVKVDLGTMETSIPGVYAAGDITGVFKQVAVAVGQGALAANSAYNRVQQIKLQHA